MPADEWDRYFINIGFSVPLEDKKTSERPLKEFTAKRG